MRLCVHVTCCYATQPPLQRLQSGDVVRERSVGVVALQVGAGEGSVLSSQVEPEKEKEVSSFPHQRAALHEH